MEHIAFFIRTPLEACLILGNVENDKLQTYHVFNKFSFDKAFVSLLKGENLSSIDFWLGYNQYDVNIVSPDGKNKNLKAVFYSDQDNTKPLKSIPLLEIVILFDNLTAFSQYVNEKNVSDYYNDTTLIVLKQNPIVMEEQNVPKEVTPYLNINTQADFNVAVAYFLSTFQDRIVQKNTNEYAKKLYPFQTFEQYQEIVKARTGEKVSIIDTPLLLSSKQAASLQQMVDEIKQGVPQNAYQIWDKQMDVIVYEFFRLIFMLNENNKLIENANGSR